MVGPCGLEPQTSTVSRWRSSQLSYGPTDCRYLNTPILHGGGSEGPRGKHPQLQGVFATRCDLLETFLDS